MGIFLENSPWSLLRSPAIICIQAAMYELVKSNGQIKN